jgi:hypothetical protein
MAASALQLEGARAAAEPAEWEALVLAPPEELAGWRVWRRRKGPGYRLMRWATKLSRFLDGLRHGGHSDVVNPNGLQDVGTVRTREEARDLCRIAHEGGKWAVTYEPVMVGRVHPLRTELARGDRRFDPFKVFDFSATDAVREQARHALVDAERFERLLARMARMQG